MTQSETINLLVDKFMQVVNFQRELYIIAGSLRTTISKGNISPVSVEILNKFIGYIEMQAGNLETFVKEMNNLPDLKPNSPEVNTFVVDPKAN